jgi:hypothetical protein
LQIELALSAVGKRREAEGQHFLYLRNPKNLKSW